jgi:hypothetical protein
LLPQPEALKELVDVVQPAVLPPLNEISVAELLPMVPKLKSTLAIPVPALVFPDVSTDRVTVIPVPVFGVKVRVSTLPKQFDPPQPFPLLNVIVSAKAGALNESMSRAAPKRTFSIVFKSDLLFPQAADGRTCLASPAIGLQLATRRIKALAVPIASRAARRPVSVVVSAG